MRSNLTLVIVCVIAGSTGMAQDKKGQQDDVAKLVSALASENPAPIKRSGPDLMYPPGYDRKKQEPVRAAKSKLKTLGIVAFRSLIEN